jgi:DNA-binding MarR family transcriptional regulator
MPVASPEVGTLRSRAMSDRGLMAMLHSTSAEAPMQNDKNGAASNASELINPLEELLGYQLRRASQAMLNDLVSALDEFALRPTTVSVLLLVASNPGITQSRIGQILAVERANMAPITAHLIKQGLLTRSPADGRSHGLLLTAAGKSVVGKIRKRIAKHEESFWKGAKAAERDSMLTFLKSLWNVPG